MKRKARISLIFVALLAVVGTAWLLKVRSFDDGPFPPSLAKAGQIPVTLSNGRQTTIGALLRPDLPTIVSGWASWCGPCRKEAPILAGLRKRYGPDKINFLYLNAREPGATSQDLDDFVVSIGLPRGGYAVLNDTSLAALTNDQENLIPRTYIFDRSGRPSAMIVGYKPLALARVEGILDMKK